MGPRVRQDRDVGPRGRLLCLFIAYLGGLILLLAGLWYVQVGSFGKYERFREVQSTRIIGETGIRGRILDRHGEVLAENRPEYGVVLYLEEMRQAFRDEYSRARKRRARTRAELPALQRLCRYLVASNICHRVGVAVGRNEVLDRERFERHYHQKLYVPFPLLDRLSEPERARFAEQGGRIPGVDLECRFRRHYPLGAFAAHAIGYVLQRQDPVPEGRGMRLSYRQPEYQGSRGVERLFDRELRGEPGIRTVRINNLMYRQEDRVWLDPEPGNDLHLTLDVRIQARAEALLESRSAMLRRAERPDAGAAVVVMDVRNGDILALASAPDFDPNEFVGGIQRERLDRLRNDEIRRPLLNRATHGMYPPGSIFKLVTALAFLEDGGVDPRETYFNPGHIRVGERLIRDTAEPGDYDFERALARSSNSYFVGHALETGPEALVCWGRRFFLGERVGLLPDQEVAGAFPSPERLRRRWYRGDTANLSIGQGEIAVTPLQMAVMVSAIANGGRVPIPRLVASSRPNPALGEARAAREFPGGRVRGRLGASRETLGLLHQAMQVEVEEGTGHRARVDGLRIGGKTGTAETGRRTGEGREIKNSWFVSFAPVEDPRYAVATLVVDGISGGADCAPISGELHRWLHILDPAEDGG